MSTTEFEAHGRLLVGRDHPPIGPVGKRLTVSGYGVRVVNTGSGEPNDVTVVHRWMNSPEVAAGWEQAWPRARWQKHLTQQLDGTYSVPLLVSDEGCDVAYVEIYRAHADVVSHCYPSQPHDIGFHIAIGPDALRGRGRGTLLIRSLLAGIFDAAPECARIVSDPDVRNEAALRVDQKLGLTRVGDFQLPHKTTALHLLERGSFHA
ncbi:GNAT family N-acetyltransferase [Rhodococcus sp. NPDC058521]|uniref:GNAT family N-acetyltransferase n=1 Tax=Rhodococcus sp. NPDC058521 TaxID=3346536 RepID=UPI0036679605